MLVLIYNGGMQTAVIEFFTYAIQISWSLKCTGTEDTGDMPSMSQTVWDVITKIPQTGRLKQQMFMSQFWKLAIRDQVASILTFLMKDLFLLCRWLSACCVLIRQREEVTLSVRATPSCLSYLPRNTHLPVASCWRLEFQHVNFNGDTNAQSIIAYTELCPCTNDIPRENSTLVSYDLDLVRP